MSTKQMTIRQLLKEEIAATLDGRSLIQPLGCRDITYLYLDYNRDAERAEHLFDSYVAVRGQDCIPAGHDIEDALSLGLTWDEVEHLIAYEGIDELEAVQRVEDDVRALVLDDAGGIFAILSRLGLLGVADLTFEQFVERRTGEQLAA